MWQKSYRAKLIPHFFNYRFAEINLLNLVDLVGELQRSSKYSNFLLGRVEEELKLLCRYIRPDSNTALVYVRTINWGEIEKAARKDYCNFGAGIYYAIAYLSHSAETAWQRWTNFSMDKLSN